MDLAEYLDELKEIQTSFLQYIDDEENETENLQDFFNLFNRYQIRYDSHKLRLFVTFLSVISNNHHRNSHFFIRIFQILQNIKPDIQERISNTQLFNIFKKNKRILLFLFEERFLIADQHIYSIIKPKFEYSIYENGRYIEYFYPEIKQFLSKEEINQYSTNIPENFEELRRIGENETTLCELIRNDSIEDFIIYVNKNNLPTRTLRIEPSIFETNYLLFKYKPTLIEYAAFFGSIQIFKYLTIDRSIKDEKVPSNNFRDNEKIEFKSIHAIHSNDAEMIQLIEDNKLKIDSEEKDDNCLIESFKCHHNNIAEYIINNYSDNCLETLDKYSMYNLSFYNYFFLSPQLINPKFYVLCKYDHYYLIKYYLENGYYDDMEQETVFLYKYIFELRFKFF